MLPGFTAEADQLELLSRSKTVTVPKVWAVGADRDYSFLVMDYLHLVRWMRIAHLFLVSKLRVYINGVTNHNSASILIIALHNSTAQHLATSWSTFFAEQRIGWQLDWQQRKGSLFGNIDAIVEHIQQRLASHQPQPSLLHGDLWSGNCALGPDGPYIFDPACYWVTESATWRCYRCILNSRHKR
ncbi:fructosamine kinase family protein [Shigella flexneri]